MSGDFSSEQKRYLEGLHVRPADRARRARACSASEPRRRSEKPTRGPTPVHIAAQDRTVAAGGKLNEQEKIKREQHPFDAYRAAEGAGRGQRISQARRQFPLALLRPVLRRAGAELLHVPAADAERHPQALAVRRARRPRRALRRRLFARHDARQPADPRHRAEERGRADRGRSRTSASARAAPAPTTSATSPARRPPASIRRS